MHRYLSHVIFVWWRKMKQEREEAPQWARVERQGHGLRVLSYFSGKGQPKRSEASFRYPKMFAGLPPHGWSLPLISYVKNILDSAIPEENSTAFSNVSTLLYCHLPQQDQHLLFFWGGGFLTSLRCFVLCLKFIGWHYL